MIALLILASVVASQNLRTQTVAVDASTIGTVYTVGANWKAQFDVNGVQLTPFLGADAPRNEYVRFLPSRVSIDGVTLASNAEAGVECTGHTLRYERGAFDEVFEARLEGLEHQLSFNALPARGELVVHCSVDSSLAAQQANDAIEFTNERGGVRYPSAIAFDAAGHRIALSTRLDDSTLLLTVPAEFVANATLPLTIDPLIQVFGVSTAPPLRTGARRCVPGGPTRR